MSDPMRRSRVREPTLPSIAERDESEGVPTQQVQDGQIGTSTRAEYQHFEAANPMDSAPQQHFKILKGQGLSVGIVVQSAGVGNAQERQGGSLESSEVNGPRGVGEQSWKLARPTSPQREHEALGQTSTTLSLPSASHLSTEEDAQSDTSLICKLKALMTGIENPLNTLGLANPSIPSIESREMQKAMLDIPEMTDKEAKDRLEQVVIIQNRSLEALTRQNQQNAQRVLQLKAQMEIMERKRGILSEGLIKQSNQSGDEPEDLKTILARIQQDIQVKVDSTAQLKEQLVAAQ